MTDFETIFRYVLAIMVFICGTGLIGIFAGIIIHSGQAYDPEGRWTDDQVRKHYPRATGGTAVLERSSKPKGRWAVTFVDGLVRYRLVGTP